MESFQIRNGNSSFFQGSASGMFMSGFKFYMENHMGCLFPASMGKEQKLELFSLKNVVKSKKFTKIIKWNRVQ